MINTEYDNVVEAILGLEIEDIQKLNALDDIKNSHYGCSQGFDCGPS